MTTTQNMIRGRSNVVTLTNKSGGALVAGDVCVIDTTTDEAATTTTSAASVLKVYIAAESIANNATGKFYSAGFCPLVTPSASVTRGRYLFTHTVAKQAAENATYGSGAFGVILKSGTTPSVWLFGSTAQGTGGSFTGTTGSTDNAVLRADGTGGATIQSSLATVDDSGSVNIPTGQTYNINNTPHTHAGGGNTWFGYYTLTPPSSAGWSWDNQGSSTIDSTYGYEYGHFLRSGAVSMRGRYRTPTNAHYRIDVCMAHALGEVTASGTAADMAYLLGFRDSGGKIVALLMQHAGGAGSWQIQNSKWTTSTSYSAAYTTWGPGSGIAAVIFRNPCFLRVDYDGTNIICYDSVDGNHWNQFDTRVATDWLAAGKPDVIWGAYINGNDVNVALLSWLETALP